MKKLTNEEFIKKAIEVHKNRYDYSLVDYKNSATKVKIICPEHGIFEQSPNNHLHGNGCIVCSGNKKLTTEEFIKKAQVIHGDKYDYSLVEYINNNTKIKIICPKHGEFQQVPSAHFLGQNCMKCSNIKRGLKLKLTKEIFIKRSNKIHNNKYDYSLIDYSNNKCKVKIICPIHGQFEQTPECHMRKCGCPKCDNKNVTTEEFIKKSKLIFGDEYDYSLVDYTRSLSGVNIICKEHGIFNKSPKKHLSGQGCQKCNISSGEKRVLKILTDYNIEVVSQHKFNDCLSPDTNIKLKFDFYIKNYNICIEYNGLQHYQPIKHFGGINKFIISKKMDEVKEEYCKSKNIPLIIIFKENENILKYRFVDLYENSNLKLKNILSNYFQEMSLIEYKNFKNNF